MSRNSRTVEILRGGGTPRLRQSENGKWRPGYCCSEYSRGIARASSLITGTFQFIGEYVSEVILRTRFRNSKFAGHVSTPCPPAGVVFIVSSRTIAVVTYNNNTYYVSAWKPVRIVHVSLARLPSLGILTQRGSYKLSGNCPFSVPFPAERTFPVRRRLSSNRRSACRPFRRFDPRESHGVSGPSRMSPDRKGTARRPGDSSKSSFWRTWNGRFSQARRRAACFLSSGIPERGRRAGGARAGDAFTPMTSAGRGYRKKRERRGEERSPQVDASKPRGVRHAGRETHANRERPGRFIGTP